MPSIGFFGDQDQLITCYDPEGYGFEVNTVERTLDVGEEIIGVYGVKDRQKWFTSFGFLVLNKVRQDDQD